MKTKYFSFLKSVYKFGFSNQHDFDVFNSKNLLAKNQFQIFIETQSTEKKLNSFEKAWEILKFETENYWRRATYFWAFQIAAFAGYFSILGSDKFKNTTNTYALFFTICVGFLTAFA